MPKMSGIEAAEHIRKTFPADRQPIIIALTADAMAPDKEKVGTFAGSRNVPPLYSLCDPQCIHAGMDDYLTKPVNVQMLMSLLVKYGTLKQTPKETTDVVHA
jgi:CheY-like chemotaxis protein